MRTGELEPLLFISTVISPNTASVTVETMKEEAGWSFRPAQLLAALSISCGMRSWQGLCDLGKSLSLGAKT